MSITRFRRALADELEHTADDLAKENGMSRERPDEDRRYFAGYASGMQAAAQAARKFMNDEDDD